MTVDWQGLAAMGIGVAVSVFGGWLVLWLATRLMWRIVQERHYVDSADDVRSV